mmetsp:Transcript_107354/g.313892  ORF Transcript_107354/g.313892 Transcript_107354/m.313892 type:complete len:528 (+) Transcript_107354:6-1589(+)
MREFSKLFCVEVDAVSKPKKTKGGRCAASLRARLLSVVENPPDQELRAGDGTRGHAGQDLVAVLVRLLDLLEDGRPEPGRVQDELGEDGQMDRRHRLRELGHGRVHRAAADGLHVLEMLRAVTEDCEGQGPVFGTIARVERGVEAQEPKVVLGQVVLQHGHEPAADWERLDEPPQARLQADRRKLLNDGALLLHDLDVLVLEHGLHLPFPPPVDEDPQARDHPLVLGVGQASRQDLHGIPLALPHVRGELLLLELGLELLQHVGLQLVLREGHGRDDAQHRCKVLCPLLVRHPINAALAVVPSEFPQAGRVVLEDDADSLAKLEGVHMRGAFVPVELVEPGHPTVAVIGTEARLSGVFVVLQHSPLPVASEAHEMSGSVLLLVESCKPPDRSPVVVGAKPPLAGSRVVLDQDHVLLVIESDGVARGVGLPSVRAVPVDRALVVVLAEVPATIVVVELQHYALTAVGGECDQVGRVVLRPRAPRIPARLAAGLVGPKIPISLANVMLHHDGVAIVPEGLQERCVVLRP